MKPRRDKGTKKNPLPEDETRRRVLAMAKRFNCEIDVLQIMEKYDRLLKKCSNEMERKHIAHTGLIELHKFFYCKGALIVDDTVLLPAEPDFKDPDA